MDFSANDLKHRSKHVTNVHALLFYCSGHDKLFFLFFALLTSVKRKAEGGNGVK